MIKLNGILYPLGLYMFIIILNGHRNTSAADLKEENSKEILQNASTTIPTDVNRTSEDTTTAPIEITTITSPDLSINNNNNTIPSTTPNYLTAKDLPNCKKYNNEFTQCLREILKMGVAHLKYGNKEQSIPRLDPFTFNRTIYRYNTGPFKGQLLINKARIYGISDVQYKRIQFRKRNDRVQVNIDAYIPQMYVTGRYKGKFHFNNFTMKPTGFFNITVKNINVEQKSEAIIYAENQHKFLKFYTINMEPKIDKMMIKATGIFEDNRLNDVVVNVINQYWREFYRILYTTVKDYWSPIVLLLTNESLKMAPFDIKSQ